MCGIAAIYAYHRAALEVNREEFKRIRDHMERRGPDDSGEWYSGNCRVGLGHRRLSIIDLTERGAQPMVSADGRLVVSFNGEIYNYRALRRDLEAKGCRFRSDSDTEVLLHLYAERGEAMFEVLRGMYALALWDEAKRALLLARDPYGIKPLYYADDGWTLRAASQVKALHAGGKVSQIPEPAGVVGFHLLGSVPEPYTVYQEIRAVPAGSCIWVDELGPGEPKAFFSLAGVYRGAAEGAIETGKTDVRQLVREALVDSVRHHLVSDVPVGAFLSAGIDSGALVGIATDELAKISPPADRRQLQTITIAFEEFRGTQGDESPLANTVANQYGTRHVTRYVPRTEFESELSGFLTAMDQPTIDGVNTWFVSKAAHEAGLKVAISGLGGDELFGGYPSFRDIPRWVRTFGAPSRVPGLGRLFRLAATGLRTVIPGINPKLAGLVRFGGTFPGAWFVRRGLFMPWELESFLEADLIREGLHRLRLHEHLGKVMQPDPRTPYARVATLEAGLYMRNQLLRDTDWTGMAHSLEVRTPLVDSVLLKTVAPLMIGAKGPSGKEYLAGAPARPLPEAVVKRPKTGFTVPVAEWLQNGKGVDIWKRVPALRREGCHWSRRWAYTVGQLQLESGG